ncbi:Acyl-CoA dehydrogenase family member 11 Short=ACAD-11 [Fibrisoma limi BUZ 3]|uniref:Acyl-CoA dehydrogenase family member 11 Short=ACAD-11 n=1 Tax=Fibrisoma limi BUZ 3 TaxID=1185876 RepID=I2GQV1_9BACT|nr:phosphotransferase family protein [Fibrisoma limi]CCH56279.1 Acyl-CoA dehydrogenase family member 11 Short=ACAD-11 [Fibrisoma limi BUZ 3]
MMDNPTAIRPGEELNQASLQTYLADNVPGFGVIESIGQFPGGYSNLTYFIRTSEREFVLRRPPFGAKDIKGGHDMGREFRVLTLLQQAGYHRIPEPVLYCDDESVIGSSFYVMVRVPGVILRAPSASKMSIAPNVMRRLSESLIDTLVDLHALDIHQTGLIGLGKPEGYIQRQVEGWHKRYVAAQTDDVPAMTSLARYLTDHLPAESQPTLLHNDFKYDNVVLNPDELSDIRAVLDWEMCTVGDPLMDVGTSLSYWSEMDDDGFRKSLNLSWLPGNLTRQEFARRYAERSGHDVSNLLYFYVFGLFKNAVVVQQIYSRYKKGLTSDPRFANLLTGVQALAQAGVKTLDSHSF